MSFRDRFRHSRFARTVLGLATATGLFAGTLTEATPASADDSLEYVVKDTEIGVFARNSPHQDDTDRTIGQGAYDGDIVKLICGVTNGDPVGPYNNHTWHKVHDLTNGQGPFWVNDHWVDTPNVANELAPGEKNCQENDGTNSQPEPKPDTQQPPHPTKIVGQCAGPFWGIYQQDICVNAHVGEKDETNHTQWVAAATDKHDVREVTCITVKVS